MLELWKHRLQKQIEEVQRHLTASNPEKKYYLKPQSSTGKLVGWHAFTTLFFKKKGKQRENKRVSINDRGLPACKRAQIALLT